MLEESARCFFLRNVNSLNKKSGTHIHVIFLDWSKAFDKLPHKRLLSKLARALYAIKGHLLDCYIIVF